jgi:hypothetical protein
VFLLGCDPGSSKGDIRTISQLTYQQEFIKALKKEEPTSKVTQGLFVRWLEHREDAQILSVGVSQILQNNIQEAIPFLIRTSKSTDLQVYTRAQALIGVGKLGTKDQIPLLESLLEDDTKIVNSRINNQISSVQIRDVALAMTLHLSGKDPREWGFEGIPKVVNPNPNSNPLFQYYSLGFIDDEKDTKRTAALKKWKDASAKEKKN